MAHKDWCGRTCAECILPCSLDESLPCSPDCPYLGKNGETKNLECLSCGVFLFKNPDYEETSQNYHNLITKWLFD